MKIEINENTDFQDMEIIINCKQMDDDILRILAMLRAMDFKLIGVKDGQSFLLEAANIIYIDTVDKKTFLYTKSEVYETPMKLYELEEQLAAKDFFRAGKSVIINFKKIVALKPDIDGKILVTMSNGEKLFVSRQYAVAIKRKLGV